MKYAKPEKCPDCGWVFKETQTQWGTLRQCTGCTTRQWLGADGEPLGTPANAFVRRARMRAHASFDRLWMFGPLAREDARRWLGKVMGLPDPHIGEMTTEQCLRVVDLSDKEWLEINSAIKRRGIA